MNKTTRDLLRAACLMLLLALFATGCFRQEFAQFNHVIDTETQRELYAPLVSGHQHLARTLTNLPYTIKAYELDASKGATPIEADDLEDRPMLDETLLLFYQAVDPISGAIDLFYFNPRRMEFSSLQTLRQTTGPEAGDLACVDPENFVLYRSLPDSNCLNPEMRKVIRFDIGFDPSSAVLRFFAHTPVLGDDKMQQNPVLVGIQKSPAVLNASGLVAFQYESKMDNLIATDFYSTLTPWKVVNNPGLQTRFPRALSDGRLLFSGRYSDDEPWRLFVCSPEREKSVEAVEFDGELPGGSQPQAVLAPIALPDGSIEQKLIALPENYDLQTISALVNAHNPSINRLRALYAAALIGPELSKLENLPVLDFSLYYTPEVGVFLDDPTVVSGDFISESIARGIFSLAQPLLDFKKNQALVGSEIQRAEIARDALNGEINERLAEAAQLYIDARYYQYLIALEDDMQDVAHERIRYYELLHPDHNAQLHQVLASKQVLTNIQSEQDYHKERLALALSQLKTVMGMPESAVITLDTTHYDLQRVESPTLQQARHRALQQSAPLSAARNTLRRMFFDRRQGPARRPTAYAGVDYGQSRKWFTEAVDDYITVQFQARYPLGSWKARRLHEKFWDRTSEAMVLERRNVAANIVNSAEEALVNLRSSLGDYRAKRSTQRYLGELLRLARVYETHGPAGSNQEVSVMDDEAALMDYLVSAKRTLGVERDLGIRFAVLWREMGQSKLIANDIAKYETESVKQTRPSLWVWKTKDILSSNQAISDFVENVKKYDIGRVYAYMYWDGEILADSVISERLTILMDSLAENDVEVWALLGEPDWIRDPADGANVIGKALKRIENFNASRSEHESRIAGVKMDLEPHSEPGWNDDEKRREALAKAYIGLLEFTQENTSRAGLPLWVDMPVTYFRPEHREMIRKVESIVDGATLMDYFDQPQEVIESAKNILAQWNDPLEIGIELSDKAPKHARLKAMNTEAFGAFCEQVLNSLNEHKNYRGMAFHDYIGLNAYFPKNNDKTDKTQSGE